MTQPMRIVVVGEGAEQIGGIVVERGHEAVGVDTELAMAGSLTGDAHADLAVVVLTGPLEPMQAEIDLAARESTCPVIGVVRTADAASVGAPAIRAAFDLILDTGGGLRETIDAALRHFVGYHELHGAFGRRAAIEQATGILMAVHGIDAQAALEMMEAHSRRVGCELLDTAEALVRSHLMLLPARPPGA